MKKGLIYGGVVLIVLGVVGYFVFGKALGKPSKAALQIASTPNARVYLDGVDTGRMTPFFDDELEVKEYTVKLMPEGGAEDLIPWEGKVNLVANIVTSINYQLGNSQESVSGEIISLEKISDSKTSSLAVGSLPDGALVKINGESKGFAPILQEELPAGEYRIAVTAPGFAERTITAQTIAGYKLTISVKLAQEELEGVAEATESAEEEEEEEEKEEEPTPTEAEEEKEEEEEEDKTTPTPIDLEKPYVLILDTPTGWLRVRMEPSTTATEAAKVNPGEAFPYLDEENGWYQIEYEEDEEGWVSGTYAELVD